MQGRKRLRSVCIFMALLLLLLSGCTKSGQENGEQGDKHKNPVEEDIGNEKTGDKDTDDKDTNDANTGDANTGDTNNDDKNGTNGDSTDVEAEGKPVIFGEGEYTDKILDRSLTKGKFAVYFLRSDAEYRSYTWNGTGGDSVLLIAPDGTTMLYDCSTPLCDAYIVYALQRLGIEKLDYFVCSHPHVDHIAGFPLIARYFDIGHVYMPPAGEIYSNPADQGGSTKLFMDTVIEKGIPYSYLVEGDTFMFSPDISVKVYNPPVDLDYDNINANEWSITLKFVYKDSSVLLAGDIGNNAEKLGRATETELIRKFGSELQADVAKMNHHGASTVGGNTKAGSKEWIKTTNSKIYVGMSLIFPEERQYYAYKANGAEALHTNMDGTVAVYTSGDGVYEVQVEKDRATNYVGLLDTVDGHMTLK